MHDQERVGLDRGSTKTTRPAYAVDLTEVSSHE
jgi:hypothetical protein